MKPEGLDFVLFHVPNYVDPSWIYPAAAPSIVSTTSKKKKKK